MSMAYCYGHFIICSWSSRMFMATVLHPKMGIWIWKPIIQVELANHFVATESHCKTHIFHQATRIADWCSAADSYLCSVDVSSPRPTHCKRATPECLSICSRSKSGQLATWRFESWGGQVLTLGFHIRFTKFTNQERWPAIFCVFSLVSNARQVANKNFGNDQRDLDLDELLIRHEFLTWLQMLAWLLIIQFFLRKKRLVRVLVYAFQSR